MAEEKEFEEPFDKRELGEGYDEEFDEEFEDDFDEELEDGKPHPLVTAGIFLGLVVLAAIICAILWNVTHKEKDTDMPANGTEQAQSESVGDAPDDDTQGEETVEAETESVENNAPEGELAQNDSAENSPGESDPAEGGPVNGTPDDAPDQEPISGTEAMSFTEVADTVTAKDVTNLRSVPSTLDSENIVAQLLNGETLARTGVNESTGWSRLEYDGQTVYAVSGYLTTDLSYKPPVAPGNPNRITTQDGRVIIFADHDDYVTPKEYVNLRTEPSTSQGQATARCQISSGTVVHRTGYSSDSGWSRVEYNGETLYVVSSMVNTTAAPE